MMSCTSFVLEFEGSGSVSLPTPANGTATYVDEHAPVRLDELNRVLIENR